MEATQLQEYDNWVADNLDYLVERYPGKVLAIHNGQVVFIGDSETEVYRYIKERTLKPMPLVFRVPREEDFHSILPT